MSEDKRYSVVLFNISPLSSTWIKEVYKKMQKSVYSEEEGVGFKNVYLLNNYLTGTVLSKVPSFIHEFDSKNRILRKKEIFFFIENDFAIDSKNQTLEFFCPNKEITRVKTALRSFLHEKSIISANIFPHKILKELDERFDFLKVCSLTISHYRHSEKVIGRFTSRVAEYEEGVKLIAEYGDYISKVKFIFHLNDQQVEIDLSKSGRISIKCSESIFDDTFQILKEAIKKNNN